jgi:hypothetical protein
LAGVITAAIGISRSQPALFLLGLGAISIGALAAGQLRTGRPHAIVLISVSELLLGITAPFMPAEVAAGLGAGVVVFTLSLPLRREAVASPRGSGAVATIPTGHSEAR